MRMEQHQCARPPTSHIRGRQINRQTSVRNRRRAARCALCTCSNPTVCKLLEQLSACAVVTSARRQHDRAGCKMQACQQAQKQARTSKHAKPTISLWPGRAFTTRGTLTIRAVVQGTRAVWGQPCTVEGAWRVGGGAFCTVRSPTNASTAAFVKLSPPSCCPKLTAVSPCPHFTANATTPLSEVEPEPG